MTEIQLDNARVYRRVKDAFQISTLVNWKTTKRTIMREFCSLLETRGRPKEPFDLSYKLQKPLSYCGTLESVTKAAMSPSASIACTLLTLVKITTLFISMFGSQ